MWSKVCCAILESDTAVFKECSVSGESLPHGDIDLVAGQVDNSGKINWSFGVLRMKPFNFYLPLVCP